MKIITAITTTMVMTEAFSFGPQYGTIRSSVLFSSYSSSSSTISTSSESQTSWEDLQSQANALSGVDEVGPTLTFYRDTNGWCPFCERVWVCMRVKNITYQERLINLQNKPDWYKELVPTKAVPAVLFHNSSNDEHSRKLVWESLDIMKALDDAYPNTQRLVLDTDDYKAARVMNGELSKAGFGYIYASSNISETELQEKERVFIDNLNSLENALEKSGGPFRLGKDFTGIDAEMIPALERWRCLALSFLLLLLLLLLLPFFFLSQLT